MNSRIEKKNIYILLFTILLLIGTMTVMLGITWSRYQASTVIEVPFEVKKLGTFKILGLVTDEEGNVTEADQPAWTLVENGNYQMDFRITNEKEDSKKNETEYYKLRIATTLGVAPVEESADEINEQITEQVTEQDTSEKEEVYKGLSLVVTTPNGIERVYKGVAEEFAETSTLYEQIGPGYLYRFVDMDGNELIWTLEGGKYSTQDHRLQIGTIVEESLMEVIVVEASVEK